MPHELLAELTAEGRQAVEAQAALIRSLPESVSKRVQDRVLAGIEAGSLSITDPVFSPAGNTGHFVFGFRISGLSELIASAIAAEDDRDIGFGHGEAP